ncbi:hypothetical protein HMPREF3217_00137, partial [Finegoldia magna]
SAKIFLLNNSAKQVLLSKKKVAISKSLNIGRDTLSAMKKMRIMILLRLKPAHPEQRRR